MPNNSPYSRTRALLGEDAFEALRRAHILVIGAGAVGGACIEALARSGIGRLTIVDGDRFEPSNLNRQPFAALSAIGRPKASAVAERLADIAPECVCRPLDLFVTEGTAQGLLSGTSPDGLVDACDDVPAKVALLREAFRTGLPAWSAMGAARKLDPTALRVTDIAATQICPLARSVRRKLREAGIAGGIRCVWSAEPARPLAAGTLGSFMPVTGAAGLLLAADVVRFLTENKNA